MTAMVWRVLAVMLVFIYSSQLAGCGGGQPKVEAPAKPRDETGSVQRYQIINEKKESQVIKIIDAEPGEAGYIVRIFDDDKKVVYEAIAPRAANYEPWTILLDNDIIEIRQGGGTGFWVSFYYDRKNNRVSPKYQSPMLVGNGKVVIPKTGKLAVSDIFDKNVYYKEFAIKDYPPIANPVDAFEEIKWQGSDKLSVTHLAGKRGETYKRETIVIDLND